MLNFQGKKRFSFGRPATASTRCSNRIQKKTTNDLNVQEYGVQKKEKDNHFDARKERCTDFVRHIVLDKVGPDFLQENPES